MGTNQIVFLFFRGRARAVALMHVQGGMGEGQMARQQSLAQLIDGYREELANAEDDVREAIGASIYGLDSCG